ncbi:hypothetical protein NDI56_03995 [Haloarcula sp. S1CR25-12]|uniref:Uncharacterized protein n=1 Tax=Haloarcula saliterrae TaxID=2950534 RepID=A0ABU2F8I0_9EURY|nr:hypothetical protein [Haloarcula sp. S1CR25-12]MDS0258572.1 hypothetical protein [Haloarcula sp. S1CR25-12]
MVWVEKTDPPNVTVRGVGEFSVGDTDDVAADDAEYLVEERGDFELVDEPGPESEWTVGDDAHEEDGAPDVDEWADWSEDSWLELNYQQRAEDVREGRVDGHLDDIADVETSDTVVKAVNDRRGELEN